MASKKPGLYANIHAKQERVAHGSGEVMRKPGDKGAPEKEDFKQAAKTEKPPAAKKKVAAKKATAKKAAPAKKSAKKPATKSVARSTTAKAAK